uniref:Uncharacterized protein n=1 Tax=Chenopodium quinoa TaxID=63459 RepID=A0A803M3L8_CHEQI
MPNNNNSAIFQAPCPKHAFLCNKTLCSCSPGYLYNVSTKSCTLFNISPLEWWTSSSVKLTKVDDGYQKAIKYEEYYVWCSVVALFMWVLLCAIVRFGSLGMEETLGFRFAGGLIASILRFLQNIGLLLHQIITTLGLEVYTMKAANAPDLISFTNDLELNITTISSMTCSQFRGPSTIVLGTPDVGFQFNFSAKSHVDEHKYANFVSGRIKNGMKSDNTNITYRGANTNVLKFNLFPRVYLNVNGLKLLQPSFHEFRPGSSACDKDKLRSLLHSPKNGLINTTLALSFLSEYMIEIDDGKRYTGLVSFLADVGGLYCLSITLFLLLLTLCQSRIKRLRNEDQVMQNIKKRRIAEDHWHKLRRFVAYTFGSRLLDERHNMKEEPTCCIGGNGLSISKFRQREINIQSFGLRRQPQPADAQVLRDASRITKGVQTINSSKPSDI